MYGKDESIYASTTFVKTDVPLISVVKMPIAGNLRTGISYPIKVTTKVVDQDGNPLEGVHLYEKANSQKGAVTNALGIVTLSNVEFDSELEFSYLGTKYNKMAGSILPTTKLIVEGWDFPETVVSAPAKKSNTWLWWLGTAVVVASYYGYKKSQKKEYVSAKL